MEMLDLSNHGVVLSYTIHHMPPEGFEVPLLLALVKLDENAVVLCTGNIADADRIPFKKEKRKKAGLCRVENNRFPLADKRQSTHIFLSESGENTGCYRAKDSGVQRKDQRERTQTEQAAQSKTRDPNDSKEDI